MQGDTTDFQPGEEVILKDVRDFDMYHGLFEGKVYHVSDDVPFWDQRVITLKELGPHKQFPSHRFRRLNETVTVNTQALMHDDVSCDGYQPATSPEQMTNLESEANVGTGRAYEQSTDPVWDVQFTADFRSSGDSPSISRSCLDGPSPICCPSDVIADQRETVEYLVVPENGIALRKSCGFNDQNSAVNYAMREQTPCIIFKSILKVVPAQVTEITKHAQK